jgi:hypothetical protein
VDSRPRPRAGWHFAADNGFVLSASLGSPYEADEHAEDESDWDDDADG